MRDVSFHDNELKDIDHNNLKLSILICNRGFSYNLFNTETKKYHDFFYKNIDDNNYLNSIEQIITENKLHEIKFTEVNVQYVTNRNTLIPETFFSEENFSELFYFNFTQRNNSSVKYHYIPKLNLYSLYEVDNEIISFLDRTFNEYNLIPQTASFINSNIKKSIVQEDELSDKMYVQFFNDFLEVVIIRDKNVLFYNTFIYKSSNDIVYYILNIFEQLKLNQEKTELVLSGFIEKDNIAVINLKKFVQFVYFESLNNDFNYFYKFQDLSPHYFHNFLNINS